jgi:Trypsin.
VSNEGAQPVNYSVVEIIRHPDYKPPAKYNDIALLKLDRHVEFNEFIRPACLYTSDTFEVTKTVATGWGKIDYGKTVFCFTFDIIVK